MKKHLIALLVLSAVFCFPGCERESRLKEENVKISNSELRSYLLERNPDIGKSRLFTADDVRKLNGAEIIDHITVQDRLDANGNVAGKIFILTQRQGDLPVFAATSIIHADSDGFVIYITCDFSMAAIKTTVEKVPKPDDALKKKMETLLHSPVTSVKPVLLDPALVNRPGEISVVWMVDTMTHRYFLQLDSLKKVWDYPHQTTISVPKSLSLPSVPAAGSGSGSGK